MALKRKSKISVEFSMASMTDMIFLLLIFFMLTSSFSTVSGLTINLPKVSEKTPNNRQPSAVITLDSNGTLYLDGTTIEKNKLKALLKDIVSESESGGKVIIEADKDTKHGFVVDAMDIAQRSGVSSISIKAILQREEK